MWPELLRPWSICRCAVRLAVGGGALAWFADRRRDLWPRRVRHRTYTLRYDRSYWMRILRLATETWLLAHQAISINPNRVSPTFRR